MKTLTYLFFALFLVSTFSCNDTEYQTEFLSDGIAVEEPVEPYLYCEWEVTAVEVVVEGSDCKFDVGDIVCYLCEGNDCPPGTISVGRNFGDGCRTFGKFTDTNCEEKEDGDCAGKYRRS